MSHLVIGNMFALSRNEQTAFLFRYDYDTLHSCGEILYRNGLAAAAGGEYSRFINQIGNIRAGEPECNCGDLIRIGIGR